MGESKVDIIKYTEYNIHKYEHSIHNTITLNGLEAHIGYSDNHRKFIIAPNSKINVVTNKLQQNNIIIVNNGGDIEFWRKRLMKYDKVKIIIFEFDKTSQVNFNFGNFKCFNSIFQWDNDYEIKI